MNSTAIQLQLDDPGSTWFHNAGIAGLWMTLSQLQREYPSKTQREGNLDWLLSDNSIYLEWNGQDFEALDWLCKQSFQTSSKGLLELTGLRPRQMGIQAQLAIHKGITKTFLQHNKFVESEGKDQAEVEIGNHTIQVSYKKIRTYAHQGFAKYLCDDQGNLQREKVSISSWLYPGLTVRHFAFPKQTKFEDTVERSLALLFSPLSCGYFALPFKPESTTTPLCVLVIPEIENLSGFAESHWRIGKLTHEFFNAVCGSDAGLKFLVHNSIHSHEKFSMRRCYVIVFGKTRWSSQQATRIDTREIEILQKDLDDYQLLYKILDELRSSSTGQENTSSFAPIRAIVSDNLIQGKPWWFNLFEQAQEHNVLSEGLKLKNLIIKMAEQTQLNIESEKLFIRACHEALRRTYAKVYDRTDDNEIARIDRKNEQILSRLKQCHNADRFRSFLADFFSKAGRIKILEENLEELFPITRGITDWRVSRDLFLLAMASYKGKEPSNEDQETQQSSSVSVDASTDK